MLKELDDMVDVFANEFNRIHRLGFEFNSDVQGEDFFVTESTGSSYLLRLILWSIRI